MRKSLGWAQFSSINVTTPLKTDMDTQTWWALENVYPYTSVHFWYQFVKRLGCKTESLSISSSSHPIHLHAGDGSMGWPYVAMPGSITGIAPAWLEGVTRPTARGCGASCSSKPPAGWWYRWWKIPWVSLNKAGYKNPTSTIITNHHQSSISSNKIQDSSVKPTKGPKPSQMPRFRFPPGNVFLLRDHGV